jgi:hypothetical protein
MKRMVTRAHELGFELYIVSDANAVFIRCGLEVPLAAQRSPAPPLMPCYARDRVYIASLRHQTSSPIRLTSMVMGGLTYGRSMTSPSRITVRIAHRTCAKEA